jgi:GT2 family glycosyltransferase
VRPNDWSGLVVPELAGWRPELRVSVVIPAYECQASLNLTLASLARQGYPADLLEVVVVDDGSTPPLELPKIRPAHCRLLRAGDHSDGWGRANALRVGAERSSGDVIHWLDADMVVYPDHVAAQARWHHAVPYAVTLGYKRFVDVAPDRPGWPAPDQVADACAAGTVEHLFPMTGGEPHDYVERLIRRTDQLRGGDHLNFLAHVGATAALRRDLYRAAGGPDPRLRLGEDTEYGYRLAQAGALFVPEPAARGWHLGRTHMMREERPLQRYNRPFLADLMPQPRWLRRGAFGAVRTWAVPLVTVVLSAAGQPLERVRAAVDAILASTEPDLRVCLVGPWSTLTDGRVPVLADPDLELRLIAATYRSDARVRLVTEAPATAFPSPYLLRVPAGYGLAPAAVARLVDLADRDQVGLVRVAPPAGGAEAVELWRTAALGRAGWLATVGTPVADLVAEVYGARTVAASAVGVVDLARIPADRLAHAAATAPAGRWLPARVEVAGARSLALATLVVGRQYARRAVARLRRLIPGRRPGRPHMGDPHGH